MKNIKELCTARKVGAESCAAGASPEETLRKGVVEAQGGGSDAARARGSPSPRWKSTSHRDATRFLGFVRRQRRCSAGALRTMPRVGNSCIRLVASREDLQEGTRVIADGILIRLGGWGEGGSSTFRPRSTLLMKCIDEPRGAGTAALSGRRFNGRYRSAKCFCCEDGFGCPADWPKLSTPHLSHGRNTPSSRKKKTHENEQRSTTSEAKM